MVVCHAQRNPTATCGGILQLCNNGTHLLSGFNPRDHDAASSEVQHPRKRTKLYIRNSHQRCDAGTFRAVNLFGCERKITSPVLHVNQHKIKSTICQNMCCSWCEQLQNELPKN